MHKGRYKGIACSALGCRNMTSKSPYKFHSYPADPLLATAWALAALRPDMLDALERPPFKLTYQKLCSLHFEDDAYSDPVTLIKLKPYALPSLFHNHQGELVRVTTDPEIQKIVKLKESGMEVKADEFLKKVIRETDRFHNTTEEIRLVPSKKCRVEGLTDVKSVGPEITPTDNFQLPIDSNMRVKKIYIDLDHMCKVETFEFISTKLMNTGPDSIVQIGTPPVIASGANYDDDDDDVICTTDIDPLRIDAGEGSRLRNRKFKRKREPIADCYVHSSLHTAIAIPQQMVDKAVGTEPAKHCLKEERLKFTLENTLEKNKNLSEKLHKVKDEFRKFLKSPLKTISLDEYVRYTNHYFSDKTVAKFVLDLLDINQDVAAQKSHASEEGRMCQNVVEVQKLYNSAEENFGKTLCKASRKRKLVAADKMSTISSNDVNQVKFIKSEEKSCDKNVAIPKSTEEIATGCSKLRNVRIKATKPDQKPAKPVKIESDQNIVLKSELLEDCLPSYTKLRNVVRAAIQPGVTKTWMNLLKIKVDTFNDYQRPCVLYVDEVPLKPKIFYNITYDKVIGVVIDSATGDVAPARYVTVVMAQGVCAPWRQPIAYHFNGSRCNGVRLKRIVTDSLHKLTDMNLKVMALMCGTDANYVQMAQMLGVSADKPQFWAAGRQAHFLFDVQRLSQDLWNAFLTVKIRLNDCIISQYVKAQAEQYPHLFPTKNSKACKVGRNYRKRIFTDKLPGGIYTYGDKIHSRDSICTNKFLTIVDNFSTLMLDKTDMFHGYTDERDPIDACFDLFNKIQPVDKDMDASVCIRRWKATVRSIANLWEEIRGLGFARMYIPSMRCFSEFSQHLPGKEKQDFYDLRLTPIQFTRAFINCFTKELLKTERTCSDEKMSENDTIFYAKLLEAANLPQTNNDDDLFTDDIDYRSVEFHFPSDLLCEYLLNKCLRQHSCPLCANYIAMHRTYMLQNPEPRGDRFIETLEILHKPHKTFFGFVAGMDSTFKLSFKSAIVHNCTVKYLTGLLRKLSLVHPCLKFPFKYVTKLYARLRLYHTLKYVDDKIKRSDESFQINDGLLMDARNTF